MNRNEPSYMTHLREIDQLNKKLKIQRNTAWTTIARIKERLRQSIDEKTIEELRTSLWKDLAEIVGEDEHGEF